MVAKFRLYVQTPLLRSLLFWGLVDVDFQFNFETRFFYKIYWRCFVSYLVRPSLATDRIGLAFWLNVSFAVNNQTAFRSISDICNRFIHLERPIFSAVRLCVYNPDYIGEMRASVIRYLVSCHGIKKHRSSADTSGLVWNCDRRPMHSNAK